MKRPKIEAFDSLSGDLDGLIVRRAEPSDLSNLLIVERESQPAPWSDAVFLRELALDYSRVWAVFDGDAIVAFLVFWVIVDEIHILNICVRTSHRRRGIAGWLIDGLGEIASRQSATIISLEVRENNQAAQKLYGGLGFDPIGLRKHYYSDTGEDAILLARILEEE